VNNAGSEILIAAQQDPHIFVELRIFSSIPTLILFTALSAFRWYLTVAFKAFVALARAVTDTQTHTHTMITRTSPPHGQG